LAPGERTLEVRVGHLEDAGFENADLEMEKEPGHVGSTDLVGAAVFGRYGSLIVVDGVAFG
jgi:hypothetical protein